MKALIIQGPRQAEIITVDRPVPGPDDVLVRVKYCGICGTDYDIFDGSSSFVKNGQIAYPIRIGHEWSGVVEETGCDVINLKCGDSVVGDNFVSCGKCEACIRGDYNKCLDKFNVGTIHPWDGAFVDYVIFPQRHIYRLPESISLRLASLCEPLSIAFGAVKTLDIRERSTVVVIGTGSIGMCTAALALHRSARQVIMVGLNDYKLGIAEKLGISKTVNSRKMNALDEINKLTEGKGAEFVIECSGAETSIADAIRYAAVQGEISLVGFFGKKINDLDIDTAIFKELSLNGIMGEYGNTKAVLQILERNDLKLENIITLEVPFSKAITALEEVDRQHDTCVKTLVCMDKQEDPR